MLYCLQGESMIRLNNYIITPTIFPDKTSQVFNDLD